MIEQKQIPIAQLFIGNQDKLSEIATEELQKVFCQNNFCKKCSTCKQIQNRQHSCSIWIKSEKTYTKDDIQIIFDTIAFKLDENQKLFFVIENADFLSDSCSNSLLKSIEEPPAGYHFILLAQRQDQIIPTIESRCIVKSFYDKYESLYENPLCKIFKSYSSCSPEYFIKIFEAQIISEKDTIKFIDIILSFWSNEYKDAIINKNNNPEILNSILKKIHVIKKAIEFSPMPGSNKIFWYNFYLQFFIG